MKILIIDDDDSRARQIKNSISTNCHIPEENIYTSSTTSNAKSYLRENYFDLLILDVVLPKRSGDSPNFNNGLTLLDELSRRASYKKPEKIIGITSHISDIEAFRNKFDTYCFSIIEASNANTTWKKNLIDAINYTMSSKISRISSINSLLVFTVHGIRTFGDWQQKLERLVTDKSDFTEFQSYKYGYFTIFSFFIPFLRNREVSKFTKSLLQVIDKNTDKKIYFFSHSFGTYLTVYAIKELIKKNKLPDINLVVLSASVLPSSYDWSEIISNSSLKVINDCGDSDLVLWLCEAFVPDTGMSGKIGFYGLNNERFINRYFKGGHSHYFTNKDFMKKFWLPLIYSTDNISVIDEREPNVVHHGLADKIVRSIGITIYPALTITILILAYIHLFSG